MSGCICKKIPRKAAMVSDLFTKADYDNGTAATPPMGWSSWNCFRGNIDEKCILEIADAMVASGLKDAGYVYLNMDDCWMASERDERGRLVGEAFRFHHDMGITIAKINERGLKAGLYTSNGTLTCEDLPSSLGREQLDAYTFARWGAEYFKYDFCHNIPISTIAPKVIRIEIGRDGEAPLYTFEALDMRLQGLAKLMKDREPTIGYYVTGLDRNAGAIDLGTLNIPEDGDYYITVTFKKRRIPHDSHAYLATEINGDIVGGMQAFCRNNHGVPRRLQMPVRLRAGDNSFRFFNPVRSRADSAMLQYINMAYMLKWATRKVAEETGKPEKPICFSICEWGANKPYLWGAKAGNLWRTTGDIFPKWHRIDELYNATIDLYPYCSKGHWNDPDMLEVGNGELTEVQNRSHFSLWCMMAAPLILGNDLRKFVVDGRKDENNPVLRIVTNPTMIAIDQDAVCKQAKRVFKGRGLDIIARPLTNGWAVCAYNRSQNKAQNYEFDVNTLAGDEYMQFVKKDSYRATDVWEQNVFETAGVLSGSLPPMGVAVFVIE